MNRIITLLHKIATQTIRRFYGESFCRNNSFYGIAYCVIVHSERREYLAKTMEILAEKSTYAWLILFTPIFCCGESLNSREAGTQNELSLRTKRVSFHFAG